MNNVTLKLDSNQIGQSTITLTAAQLAAIHAQENAALAPPASTQPASPTTQRRDGASPAMPPAHTPPAPSGGNPNGPTAYPVDAVKLADAMYLYRMDLDYRLALGRIPGAHQVQFDILTNGAGKRWSDGVPQPAGTVNDPALKTAINRVINWAGADNAAATTRFDVDAYSGPLKAIYANIVAAKLAGKA